MAFDSRAHAFAVVEAVNRARMNPPEYADALAAQVSLGLGLGLGPGFGFGFGFGLGIG